jgi:hypothetical protein
VAFYGFLPSAIDNTGIYTKFRKPKIFVLYAPPSDFMDIFLNNCYLDFVWDGKEGFIVSSPLFFWEIFLNKRERILLGVFLKTLQSLPSQIGGFTYPPLPNNVRDWHLFPFPPNSQTQP